MKASRGQMIYMHSSSNMPMFLLKFVLYQTHINLVVLSFMNYFPSDPCRASPNLNPTPDTVAQNLTLWVVPHAFGMRLFFLLFNPTVYNIFI